MGVSGGLNVFRRFREGWNRWPLVRSTSSRDGKGAVRFASTDEVLTLVYRPNLSVRDVCTEAAVKVNVSPVALDFFTLVTEDGSIYLSLNKTLTEAECNQTYCFKLSIKACHGEELWDLDPNAFEYYFHQCRQEFLRGTVGEFGENNNDFAKVILYEIVYCAKQRNVSTKHVIENPNECGIRRLFQRGVFKDYPLSDIKTFLQEKVHEYEKLSVKTVQVEYIRTLERAEDFFVHKLSFEKIYMIDNEVSNRKFEVQVSAEFGIKKRRTDTEKNLPEDIVKEFSEVEALELDPMKNTVTIIRKNSRPEILTASSPQVAYSLITLVEGYYRLMINQYKQLLRGPKRPENLLCHGPIMRLKAENLLQKGTREDGSFLLRKSRSRYSSYVLSVYHAKEVKHFRIVHNTSVHPSLLQLENEQRKGFSTLFELIEHYKQSPHGLPVCLTTICSPKTEGLAALLNREIPTPAAPEFHLVDDSVKISLEDLVIKSQALAKGEFGEVRKGSWWCSSAGGFMPVASRALVKPVGREKLVEYRKAMSTFLELKNQHLILFHGIAENQKALIFVFEFAAEGSLDEYIRKESGKEKGITKGRVISYAAQIAEGMMFLHSKDCVHGRLSAHNVLVASEDCVKISDSGLLDLVENKQSFYASRKENRFSYCWFSPLSLQSHSFNKKSDVWAFGVTVWEMFVMKKPFHCNLEERVLTRQEVLSRYLQGQYLNPHRPNVPVKVQELIKRCCSAEPQDRPDFQDMVVNLWSPELVSEKEAKELLLLPNINELEDWENPVLPGESDLELQKRRADSGASNADYSCLPGPPPPDNSISSNNAITLPSITVIPNSASFNSTILRKESLSKTFSHPLLLTNDTLPSRDPVNVLTPRKVSITRASSCPPAIEATNEEPYEGSELSTGQLEKRQREVRFIQPPMSSSSNTTGVKMPCAPLLPQLELEMLGSSTGISVDTNVEELDDSGDNSGGDDDEQRATEAMAMQCLARHVKTTAMPPTNYADDVLSGTHESNSENRNDQWSELSAIVVTGHGGGSEIFRLDLSGAETIPECDKVDNKFETTTSFSQPCEAVYPTEDLRKLSAGSYVKLSMISRTSVSSDNFEHAETEEGLSVVPNSSDDSHASDASPYQSLGAKEVTQASSSSSASSYPHDVECSLSERDTEQANGSPEFCSTSSEALLGSFSNLRLENGLQSMKLIQFLCDAEDSSVREETSPLITDLPDSSDNEDASSLEDAESSLGKMFHSGFNRMTRDNTDESGNTLDLSLHALTHLGFGLDPPEQQELEDDTQSHQNKTRPPLDLDNNTLVLGFDDREEVEEDHGSYSPEESRGILPNISTSTITTFEHSRTTLMNSTDTVDNTEQEVTEALETLDDELGLPCGSVGDSPGKVRFLNSPTLPLVEGLENFEMKEFPLNNLSKECPKSTGLLCFKDNQASILEIASNQLDDALSEDGYSLDDEQAFDDINKENDLTDPYSVRADVNGVIQEISHKTQDLATVDSIRNEQHPTNIRAISNGYQPTPQTEEQEQRSSPNQSSSSEGIWPIGETVDKVLRRKSTTGSFSSSGDQSPTIELDMDKIPPNLQIPYEQLQLQGSLGQGHFGKVMKASRVYTDYRKNRRKEDVAVKVLKPNATPQSSNDFVKEVQNMVELASKQKCPFIIELRGVSKDSKGELMLVTELAPLGALCDYLPENKKILGTRQLLDFCMQICKGMRYLEDQSLLHRDLAARNILVMREDLVKISDFGLSRLQDYYRMEESDEPRFLPVKWYALESLLKGRFTTKSDVWSFGVTMWEIFSYIQTPFEGMESPEVIRFLADGQRLGCPEKCPPKIFEVMESCWLEDPKKRPSFYMLEIRHLPSCLSEQSETEMVKF